MWWEYTSSGSRNNSKQFSILWSSLWTQPSNSSRKPKQSIQRGKIILSMMKSKNNESLPQAGNDEIGNIWAHTCKANWDGLQSRDTLLNKSCKHGQNKNTHQEQLNGKNNHKQQIRCQCGSTKNLRITTKDFPVDISYWKAKKNELMVPPHLILNPPQLPLPSDIFPLPMLLHILLPSFLFYWFIPTPSSFFWPSNKKYPQGNPFSDGP